jgi:DNA-binding NarL/FixJ family response regulator
MGDGATTRPRVRVGVVDGHPLVREGLKAFLAAAPGIDVVGEAADGEEAMRLVGAAAPELVVLGFDLARGPNGVAVCHSLKALPEPPRVLVLAGHNFAEAMLPFLLAGADSYLHRARDRGAIVDAAQRTATGERVWDGAERLGEAVPIVRAGPQAVRLTRRELEVLTLKHHRLTNADIAVKLSISHHTVKHHVSNIRSKLASAGAATPAAPRRR